MEKQALVQFLKHTTIYQTEKPFQIFGDLSSDAVDQRKTNLAWEEKQIQLHDFRHNADRFQLDTHGFTIRCFPGFTELPDRESITEGYISAIKEMLQTELEEVGTVFVFDWRVSGLPPSDKNVSQEPWRILDYSCDLDPRKFQRNESWKQDQFQRSDSTSPTEQLRPHRHKPDFCDSSHSGKFPRSRSKHLATAR